MEQRKSLLLVNLLLSGGYNKGDCYLTGRANPCGKLPDTFARDLSDYPSTARTAGRCNPAGRCKTPRRYPAFLSSPRFIWAFDEFTETDR